MSKKIIALVFAKAEKEIGPSKKTQRAQHISEVLLEDYKFPISERTLRDYYTRFVEKDEENLEPIKPQVIEYLCNYLGYKNYPEFITAHPSELEEPKVIEEPVIMKVSEPEIQGRLKGTSVGFFNQGSSKIVSLLSVVVISALTYFGFVKEEQNCMVWQEDHYEKSACTGVAHEEPYQELVFLNFRKINDLQEVKSRREKHQELWYVKKGGEVEFFTYYHEHPIYHKGLHKVTDYMYKTHVLDKLEE
ncbi:hypothetical protein [Cellulophaga baltica]|uniref:Transcriptional regulator n=1 Tax=Cellulophaga baltica 18 TaxID=1348584 RepID=A0AAU8R876_9FLAO|nr:hypothetical protein [Cellulophaga baltica]AIZ40467.1 hypothetical protein M666_02080 [Cellulophaga baltica 18]